MLGRLVKNLWSTRRPRSSEARESGPADVNAEIANYYNAAVVDWRAGRVSEAVAGCKKALELAPNLASAHSLLAAIDLAGEDYFRVLRRIHEHLRPRTYVEIGVAEGDSIRAVGGDTRALGVDPNPAIKYDLPPNIAIFAETSDDFFAKRDIRSELGGVPIDLAFIDGMHLFEYALRDFMNIEALCTPASTILIHDVYPLDERTAARERVTQFWTGDIWRLILLLRKHRPDLEVHTIAAYPTGLGIVRNLDPRSSYIRDHLEELIDEYLAVEFETLGGGKAERLALFPNDWTRIRALLDAPSSAADQ